MDIGIGLFGIGDGIQYLHKMQWYNYMHVNSIIVCISYFYVHCRYGFAENPKLELVATPKLGQREVTLSYVTDWIEKKLCEVVEVSRREGEREQERVEKKRRERNTCD